MEQPENLEKNKTEVSRERIQKWLDTQLEKKAKGEHYDAHADYHLDPADLTEQDIEVLHKVENGSITTAEINSWRKEIGATKPKDKDSADYRKWDSRHTFCLLVANLANSVIGFRELGIKRSVEL